MAYAPYRKKPENLLPFEEVAFEALQRRLVSGSTYVHPSSPQRSADDIARFNAGDLRAPVYSRIGNPNNHDLEDALLLLEGSEAKIARTASCGMAAVRASLLGSVRSGDHIVASRHLFGASSAFLDQLNNFFGVEVTYIDGRDPEEWRNAAKDNTKAFFFETPSNPLLHVLDIREIARIAHDNRDILVIADNSLVSPLAQKPLALGADIICSSLTKYFSAGEFTGGVVIISEEGAKRLNRIDPSANDPEKNKYRVIGNLISGDALSPVNAFHFLGQLLTIRQTFQQHCSTAKTLADDLTAHGVPVLYPASKTHPQYAVSEKQLLKGADGALLGGGVFSVDCGGREKAFAVISTLIDYDFSPSTNFGQPRAFAVHQATNTFAALTQAQRDRNGITDGLVRISPGLEQTGFLLEAVRDAFGIAPRERNERLLAVQRYRFRNYSPEC